MKNALLSATSIPADEDSDEKLLARLDQAAAEEAAKAQAEQVEYSNAIVTFDEVAKDKNATLETVNSSLRDLYSAAHDNAFGQDVYRDIGETLYESGRWRLRDDGFVVVSSALEDRISLGNVKVVDATSDLPRHIAFDLLVDGKSVGNSLEWLDEDDHLVRQDRHLDVNRKIFTSADRALDDDRVDINDISIAAFDLLRTAVEEFRIDIAMRDAAKSNPVDAGDLFDFDAA